MQYIVCQQPGQLLLREKDAPIPQAHEALIAIKKIGICGTDLHAYAGRQAYFSYPRILGHELAAVVLEIGHNAQGIAPGDQVIVMPYISCGKCIACTNGKTNCCVNMAVLGVHTDGGMQEKMVVRNDLLIKANHLSYHEMAIVEPLAIGAHAIRRAGLKAHEFVVVVGCGPIGIGIIKLAQIMGAKVIALETNNARIDFVRDQVKADYVLNALEEPVAKIAALTNGDMATAVFDATGYKVALEKGLDYMAHGGRYVLVGLSKGELTFQHPKIHAKESTIMCSRNATLEDFEHVIQSLPQFPTAAFITNEFTFKDLVRDFEHLMLPKNKVIKAMVSLA